jgi:prepilin-type processing-associated H-X9-DG protein
LVVAGALIAAILLYPLYVSAPRDPGRPCLSAVRQLALASLMYTADHDDRFMDRDQWMDAIEPYHKTPDLARCPEVPLPHSDARPHVYGYAFNSRLSSAPPPPEESLATTPLVYDSNNLSRNASDPFTSLPIPNRHRRGNNVGYTDGHAASVPVDVESFNRE